MSLKKKPLIYFIYMCKEDLALNNLQRVVGHKTKGNETKPQRNGRRLLELLT